MSQFTENDVYRYLGPGMVHPIEYWCKMWRMEDTNGRKFVVKCTEANACVIYYTDAEGIEHRDALTSEKQFPEKYRKEKIPGEISKTLNTNTKLSYETVVALFGDAIIDPDIPFIYNWRSGSMVLTLIGNVFSYVEDGRDDRSTVTLFGHLPPQFRNYLNTQENGATRKSVPVPVPNPKEVLKKTEASKAAENMESHPDNDQEYDEGVEVPTKSNYRGPGSESAAKNDYMSPDDLMGIVNKMPKTAEELHRKPGDEGKDPWDDDVPPDDLILDESAYKPDFDTSSVKSNSPKTVSDSDMNMDSLMKRMGIKVTKGAGDDSIPDDDDRYRVGNTDQKPAMPPANRKAMETAAKPMTLEAWEGVRDGKAPAEIVTMRRKIRAQKAAATRKANKAKKLAKTK